MPKGGFFSISWLEFWDDVGTVGVVAVGMGAFISLMPLILGSLTSFDFYEETNLRITLWITHGVAILSLLIILFNAIQKMKWRRAYKYKVMIAEEVLSAETLKAKTGLNAEETSAPDVSETLDTVREDIRGYSVFTMGTAWWSGLAALIASFVGLFAVVAADITVGLYFVDCKAESPSACAHGSDSRNVYLYFIWTLSSVALIWLVVFLPWKITWFWRIMRHSRRSQAGEANANQRMRRYGAFASARPKKSSRRTSSSSSSASGRRNTGQTYSAVVVPDAHIQRAMEVNERFSSSLHTQKHGNMERRTSNVWDMS